jgi:60kDa lysophospholipase
MDHVVLLRKSGAHLHADERAVAEMQARRRPGIWALAGVGARSMKERDELENSNRGDGTEHANSNSGWTGNVQTMAGSAPA